MTWVLYGVPFHFLLSSTDISMNKLYFTPAHETRSYPETKAVRTEGTA